ncbi:MAG TPA: hypothetical protein VFV03_07475 [Solirubrobacteraceae bacterium]|nr:hypothetical protein [Solirubrobacteraceae bacterium]
MDIAIENLPAYEQISSEPIREAAAQFSAARASLHESKRSLIDAEQTLPCSQWKDAELSEAARNAGKPEPKRVHTQQHERRIADLGHEQRVCELAERRAEQSLVDALDEHGQMWVESIDAELANLDDAWTEQVRELIALHEKRSAVIATRSKVCGPSGRAGALGFKPSEIKGLDWATGTNDRQTGYVDAGSVFGALSDLGMPEPVAEKESQQHRPPTMPNVGPNRGRRDVENEIAERREFAERASSPERVEARQRRSELLRQQNEAARTAEVG